MKNKILIPLLSLLLLCLAVSCNDNTVAVRKISRENDINSLNTLAFYYETQKVWDSAFYYHNAARAIYSENQDHTKAAAKLLAMADIQLIAGDYPGTESTTKEALPLLSSDTVSLGKAYLILASAYKSLFNYDSAINYYNKAHSATKDPIKQLDIKHHIACSYTSKGDHATAIAMLKTAATSPHTKNDPGIKSCILDNLGHAYFKEDAEKGLNEMLSALSMRKKNNDLKGQFSSLIHLSEFYINKNNSEANNFARQAYSIAVQINNPDAVLKALTFLINSSQGNDLKKYSTEYITKVTALKNARLKTQEKFDKAVTDTKEQEAKTLKINGEKERELMMQISSDHNKLLLLCLVFTIFSSLLVYYLIKLRHKRERLMEGYITETRIAKKVHDEIANEIYATINYLAANNDIEPEKKEKIIAKLDDIYLMTKNISRETNNIETGYQYPEHLKMMLSSYSGNSVNTIVKGISDIEWHTIDAIKKIATYRSLQELMVNMKKHSQATLVVIDFAITGKKIKISYTDNGRGASEEKMQQKNGLLNVEDRIKAIDGSVDIDTATGKGFHITLTYPALKPYV